ncbi:MAG: aryl-sulfate sulfotransferase [Ignavibacteriaceae bacterium]|nr:aryl-sulfate sulfotransferase [Ignavibacteriaceae bacterium]
MKKTEYINYIKFLLIFISFLTSNLIYSQVKIANEYQFISPVPGSHGILPESNIIIREGEIIDITTKDELFVEVTGSKSGSHYGQIILSDDSRTLIFKPVISFSDGEEVFVDLKGKIKTISGRNLPSLKFNFFIISENYKDQITENISKLVSVDDSNLKKIKPNFSTTDKNKPINKLSRDFPEITVNISNHPSTGNIFLTLNSIYALLTYLVIADNSGMPIYYLKTSGIQRNFQLQPNGLLTYFDQSSNKFLEMDSSYSRVDSFYCKNGFEATTDFHDLIVLENGHSILLGRDVQVVNMDTVISGGDTAAVVEGFVIQEQDANKNVIFQWRTFDHFQITDATEDVNLLNRFINPFHCNSLEIDSDENIILSSRHLDEITKINRLTGEIIWRWGGINSKNNEFLFINDPLTFSHQHDVSVTAKGTITLFDNGNLHNPPLSRAKEYDLDEVNKKATLIWSYINTPGTFSGASGSTQRLSDGNTFVGWGVHEGVSPDATEINAEGNIALNISLPDSFSSYRVYRYAWKTNLFFIEPDSIFFESVSVGDSAIISVLLKNNSADSINITSFFNRKSAYVIEHPVPFTLLPFETEPIDIKFKPYTYGLFKDTLHIRSDTDIKRIAQLLVLAGRTDTSFSNLSDENFASRYILAQNYPNPFNPNTKIKFQIADIGFVSLKVYDILGNEITTLINEERSAGIYELAWNASNQPSGIYFYQIRVNSILGDKQSFINTKKMLLLK